MSKFNVGDKVVRTKPVSPGTERRTGIVDGYIYTVAAVGDSWIKLLEAAETSFTFSASNFELAPDACWSLERAKQLQEAAINAVEAYNEYLRRQPRMQPILTK